MAKNDLTTRNLMLDSLKQYAKNRISFNLIREHDAKNEIPLDILKEMYDHDVLGVHLLLIPKEHYANIIEMTDSQSQTLARCLKKLSTLTDELGLQNGFRLVSNKGEDGCQSVGHLHIHILGGRKLSDTMC